LEAAAVGEVKGEEGGAVAEERGGALVEVDGEGEVREGNGERGE